METKKTFAQQVREKYGDTVEQFAFRIGASPETVKKWESGAPLQCTARAILFVAHKHDLPLKPEVSAEFLALTPAQQVEKLRAGFGDTKLAFAQRIGVTQNAIHRWTNQGEMSPIGQRLLLEVAEHPERFVTTPKAF